MKYSWKISAVVVLVIIVGSIFLFFVDQYGLAVLLGSLVGTATSPRILVGLAVGAIALRFVNPIIIAVVVGVLAELFLHLTLQEYWAQLGIQRSFIRGAFLGFLSTLIVLSTIHAISGLVAHLSSEERNG